MQRSISRGITPSHRIPGAFDPVPRWFIKTLMNTGEFAKFEPLAFKVLHYFSYKRRWDGHRTPWTSTQELSQEFGVSWRRMKRALSALEEVGVVRTETEKREKRFRLNFQDPLCHEQAFQQRNGTALASLPQPAWQRHYFESNHRTAEREIDSSLDASVEGHSPSGASAESSHIPGRFGTQPCPKRQADLDDDGEAVPDWVSEPVATTYP